MARLPLHPDQVGHLHLYPTQTRQVTVTDVKDPHRASLKRPPHPIPRPGEPAEDPLFRPPSVHARRRPGSANTSGPADTLRSCRCVGLHHPSQRGVLGWGVPVLGVGSFGLGASVLGLRSEGTQRTNDEGKHRPEAPKPATPPGDAKKHSDEGKLRLRAPKPATPQAEQRDTAVFFHAHPDDEALLTAGTMAMLAAQGHRVVLVVATSGELGQADLEPGEALGAARMAELYRSAAALGCARVVNLGYGDSGL
ncbi:PIG-L deacetylase family protein, partial [Streptosporangium algeriense]